MEVGGNFKTVWGNHGTPEPCLSETATLPSAPFFTNALLLLVSCKYLKHEIPQCSLQYIYISLPDQCILRYFWLFVCLSCHLVAFLWPVKRLISVLSHIFFLPCRESSGTHSKVYEQKDSSAHNNIYFLHNERYLVLIVFDTYWLPRCCSVQYLQKSITEEKRKTREDFAQWVQHVDSRVWQTLDIYCFNSSIFSLLFLA